MALPIAERHRRRRRRCRLSAVVVALVVLTGECVDEAHAFCGTCRVNASRRPTHRVRNDGIAGSGVASDEAPTTVEAAPAIDGADGAGPPPEDPGDAFFRNFRRRVPTAAQHFLRDAGLLRALVDAASLLGVPAVCAQHPSALGDWLRLGDLARWIPFLPDAYASAPSTLPPGGVRARTLRYGPHPRQTVYVLSPRGVARPARRVAFVHGGAWGSGSPALYRLVAAPFLGAGWEAAVVGYRTYPTADAAGQADDVARAVRRLEAEGTAADGAPGIPTTLVGHSSGAHIVALALATGRLDGARVDQFVGLAGVYDIPAHYRHERTRGVERISPMAAACGAAGRRLPGWRRSSPARLVAPDAADEAAAAAAAARFPPTLLVHGLRDGTAPPGASARLARSLARRGAAAECLRPPAAGHADLATDLMFGGATRDAVLEWIAANT